MAAIDAYLNIASDFYEQDRLDDAMQVVTDAFEREGWPEGGWTAFYNSLVCEKDARDAGRIHKIDYGLQLEVPKTISPATFEMLKAKALDARAQIGQALRVGFVRPILVTVFLPDAPLDFISGSYGFATHKYEIDKVCFPYRYLDKPREVESTLLHEFTHLAVYELAGQLIGNRWINEGLAMHLCGDASEELCREAVEESGWSQEEISLAHIEDILISHDDYRDDRGEILLDAAYYLAGSFVVFLVKRFGLDMLREVIVRIGSREELADHAIRKVTGERLRDIERDWRASVG